MQFPRRTVLAGGLVSVASAVGWGLPDRTNVSVGIGTASSSTNVGLQVVTPEGFGAVGDGIADDRRAFVQAVLAAAATGSIMSCRAGAVYALGDLMERTPLVQLAHANLTILGNGAQVRVNTTVANVSTLFSFVQPERVLISDLRVTDTGYDETNWAVPKGVCAFRIMATSIANGGNVTFNDCVLDCGVAFLICAGEAETKRVAKIRFLGLNTVRNSYYGICCQAQGDDIAGILKVKDVRRAYIGYGNDGVMLHFDVHRTREMANGSTGCISITSSTFHGSLQTETRNIHITAYCSGYLDGYGALALFQLQSDTAAASIKACSVRLDLANATRSPVSGVAFRSYNLAGVEVTGGGHATGRYDDITIAGDLGAAPITIPATQTSRGRLLLKDGAEALGLETSERLLANFTVG